jgi:2,4-dienoyl-CoA reductase-like NADH-dependent reductase (Old Yellow Enzyme family)
LNSTAPTAICSTLFSATAPIIELTSMAADVSMPRALEQTEIPGTVADFRHACTRTIEAGFDGDAVRVANISLLADVLSSSFIGVQRLNL